MGRGRKPKDPPESPYLLGMAILLENGRAKTPRAAAIRVVRRFRISQADATEESIVDRLRKRFKKLEPELREKARRHIAERNRPEIPPSLAGSSWTRGKKLR